MGGIELPCELPLPYSPELGAEYEGVADAVIDQVLEAFADFRANPTLDSRKWKLVKEREDVRIYYQRERNPPSALHKPLPLDTASPHVLAQSDWSPMVKLLVTGTTLGSVDDAMYGSASPTDLTALMKSISVQDDFYHHKTLRHIKLPTVEEPFTYVGLKWRARSSYIASLIKARDMVLIESTGFRQVEIDGKLERIGYALYHSVDLPEVAPLLSQGILRSKYSACVLYREQAPGVVEVFSTTSLQPAGELMFKVTAFQAAEALIAVTKLTESAMKKKLVWMQAARAYGAPNATSEYTPMWRSMRQSFSGSFKVACDQCSRELKGLRATTKCEICTTPVCSRCITSRKLVFGYKVEELDYRSVPICKGCISTAVHMDNAQALAVYEFVQPFDRLRGHFNKPSHGDGGAKRPKRRFSSAAQQAVATQLTDLSLDGLKLPDSRGSRATDERTTSCADLEDTFSQGQPTSTSRDETPKRFSDEATREQVRLWQQINNLCLQAEETYRLAVRQTSAIHHQHSLDEQD